MLGEDSFDTAAHSKLLGEYTQPAVCKGARGPGTTGEGVSPSSADYHRDERAAHRKMPQRAIANGMRYQDGKQRATILNDLSLGPDGL